jgi:predicted PhzF superfamily epimerase YddE/YHI9
MLLELSISEGCLSLHTLCRHCALAPYWLSAANKARLTGETPDESTALAKQVSERGGLMKLVWDREASRVRLIGKAVKTAEGTLFY